MINWYLYHKSLVQDGMINPWQKAYLWCCFQGNEATKGTGTYRTEGIYRKPDLLKQWLSGYKKQICYWFQLRLLRLSKHHFSAVLHLPWEKYDRPEDR